MANAVQGEATVTLKDGRTLTLKRSLRALAIAETTSGVSVKDMAASIAGGGPTLTYTAAFLYGALQAHHSDVSFDEVYDLLETDGELLSEAFGNTAPESAPATGEAPPASGTGTPCSPRGAKKVSTRKRSGRSARAS